MKQMHRTFMESFSDYAVPYKLTLDEFAHKMRHKIHLNYAYTFGAFSNEKLVAFVFHSINQYENNLTAYNGGTGVLKGHRGNKLPAFMYDHALPALSSDGIRFCVLEVLQSNQSAIKVYEQIGFYKTKQLACFQLKFPEKLKPVELNVESVKNPDLQSYIDFGVCKPSFGDTMEQLKFNINYETTLEVKVGKKLAGYLIFQPLLGRITQFGVREEHRRNGIGRTLFAKAARLSRKTLSVINVNRKYTGEINFLESIGFVNTLDQFEMKLEVK
jgi:ribosomal protein S18 acetylase RimI-like enzyme